MEKDIPTLDTQVIQELKDLMGQELSSLIGIFLRSNAEKFSQLELLQQGEDSIHELETFAHSVKGSAGNIGASKLASLAEALELAAYQERTDKFAPLITQLKDEWKRVEQVFVSV